MSSQNLDVTEVALAKIEDDLRFLMQCLHDVLVSIGEPNRAQRLPFVGDAGTPVEVRDARDAAALSLAFQALNLVEENAWAQSRRTREATDGLAKEPGLWGQSLRELVGLGLDGRAIVDVLRGIRVEPVLTAHPTEAKPRDVIEQQRALYLLLVRRENQMWTPSEQADITDEIKVLLEGLWRTGEFLEKKPQVADERANALHYLKNVFPQVLPWLDARLRHAWESEGLDVALLGDDAFPCLSFGSWIGGDRDGHPLVTGDVTRATLAELREAALELHRESLERLGHDLPLAGRLQAPPHVLKEAIARLRGTVDVALAKSLEAAHAGEPWRELVHLMRARLATYASKEELLGDLDALSRSLDAVGAQRIAHHAVAPVARSVRVFGLHLASLDVRQNSSYHDKAVVQLFEAAGLDASGFDEWDEERRRALLDDELRSARPLAPVGAKLGDNATGALDALRALADSRARHGIEGLGAIIVSMTRDVSDLLVPYLLAREVGLVDRGADGSLSCALPVVPLFETLEDLENAPRIMEGFLDHPLTRASITRTKTAQIMIGYSDSCKDAGILASQWGLHRAQQRLSDLARARGIKLRFFHGRGGTVSRGAGPTHRFLEALPHGSLSGDVRLTEQGETIAQKFANRITATYHLELLLAGVTMQTVHHQLLVPASARPPDPDLEAVLDRLAAWSRDAYRALVADDAFMPYFAEATPIDALEKASIGSRPARRTGRRSLDDLRAIPWVFAWNQSRHYMPGWYGLGTGIEKLRREDPHGFDRLRAATRTDPFVRYVVNNVEGAVASAALDIAASYASLVSDEGVRKRIGDMIATEHARTTDGITALLGAPLPERRPRMWHTLRLRDQGLRALHAYQVDMLARWRGGAEALLPSVLVSINAIASGLRTTG